MATAPHDIWARFKFSVVGPLLAAPPDAGALRDTLQTLAERTWRHPLSGEPVRFGFSTLERWYYAALRADNPFEALRRGVRSDLGRRRRLSDALAAALRAQYRAHRHWSYQLHHDNLAARVKSDPSLGPMPSYTTVARYLKVRGLMRTKRTGNERRPGLARASAALDHREVRSYEVEHTGALWHLDFHGSRYVSVLWPDGTWVKPQLFAVLDDHSRLCCHAQFYQAETTETLVHGLGQAILKRGLPRAILMDNGGAMLGAELVEGLTRLGIVQETTLPYSPHQNGKQEHFWAVVEGRLLAMLDGVAELTLERLNQITQAWVERDYHRAHHSEIDTTPLRGRPAVPLQFDATQGIATRLASSREGMEPGRANHIVGLFASIGVGEQHVPIRVDEVRRAKSPDSLCELRDDSVAITEARSFTLAPQRLEPLQKETEGVLGVSFAERAKTPQLPDLFDILQ